MKTVINIGTNQGNLTNQVFDKDFRDIKFPEVFERPVTITILRCWEDKQ